MKRDSAQLILDFWFGDLNDQNSHAEQAKIWWGKNVEIDQYIDQHFQQDVLNAMNGKYQHWLTAPKSTLALIILLDQFTRHIYRNTPKAFAYDALALKSAKLGLSLDYDKQLSIFEQAFFYMPFEHAENLAEQERAVSLFYQLYQRSPAHQKDALAHYHKSANDHKAIIERFGRFPHRNEILNRISTLEEQEFLKGPNSSF